MAPTDSSSSENPQAAGDHISGSVPFRPGQQRSSSSRRDCSEAKLDTHPESRNDGVDSVCSVCLDDSDDPEDTKSENGWEAVTYSPLRSNTVRKTSSDDMGDYDLSFPNAAYSTRTNQVSQGLCFDDGDVVFVKPDAEATGHPLADFQVPFGPRVQETYPFEAGVSQTFNERLAGACRLMRRQVRIGVSATQGVAADAAGIGRTIAEVARRTGQAVNMVIEEGWPDVVQRLGPMGFEGLRRLREVAAESLAALPPLERHPALGNGHGL